MARSAKTLRIAETARGVMKASGGGEKCKDCKNTETARGAMKASGDGETRKDCKNHNDCERRDDGERGFPIQISFSWQNKMAAPSF